MGCAVHSTLRAGQGYTTLEFKVNFVRPLTEKTGPVRAEGKVIAIAADKRWSDLLADGRLPRFALICLGVWLNAADSLETSTIMPSVGAQLGGYAYFSWATAGYLVGAILAGASAGRISEMFGLRAATAIAGLIMAGGCIMSALAPNVGLFLAGRLIQKWNLRRAAGV